MNTRKRTPEEIEKWKREVMPKMQAARAASRPPFEQRFWKYVDKLGPDDCWVWTGHKNFDGYGHTWNEGHMLRAHRAAWMLAGREAPKWPMVLDHICRNRACVNVAHLRVVHHHVNVTKLADRSKVKERWRESRKKNIESGTKRRYHLD